MDYVCLAAGKGTRFGGLGRYLQKCMYPIGTSPFLEYTLDNLVSSHHLDRSSDRLILVVGHLGEQLVAYFGSSFRGLPITYVQQPEALGTGHALKTFAGELPSSHGAIIWLADLYVPTDLFEACAASRFANMLTLAPAPPDAEAGIRVEVANGRVVKAWHGNGAQVDIGLWKMEQETMERMADVHEREYRVLPNMQALIDRGLEVGVIQVAEWVHLGGTQPTAHDNVLAVVDRLRKEGNRP